MIALTLLMNFILAFIATCGFSIVFNVPKKELLFTGMTGGLGWMLLRAVLLANGTMLVTATLCASLLITFISRYLAYLRKTPISVYLVGGIIPLVPGTIIYQTMFNLVIFENSEALSKGVETLKVAGVIIIGIVIVLSIPWKVFYMSIKPLEKVFRVGK